MTKDNLIKEVVKERSIGGWRKWLLNRYFLAIFIFAVWMFFFDSSSVLVINELNNEINRYEKQLDFYKSEYQKNDGFYKKLMNNKQEREKFARENYFMKKKDEEIFILVVDSTSVKKK